MGPEGNCSETAINGEVYEIFSYSVRCNRYEDGTTYAEVAVPFWLRSYGTAFPIYYSLKMAVKYVSDCQLQNGRHPHRIGWQAGQL